MGHLQVDYLLDHENYLLRNGGTKKVYMFKFKNSFFNTSNTNGMCFISFYQAVRRKLKIHSDGAPLMAKFRLVWLNLDNDQGFSLQPPTHLLFP